MWITSPVKVYPFNHSTYPYPEVVSVGTYRTSTWFDIIRTNAVSFTWKLSTGLHVNAVDGGYVSVMETNEVYFRYYNNNKLSSAKSVKLDRNNVIISGLGWG